MKRYFISPKTALAILEAEYLCEWGNHRLQGRRMSQAYMLAHIALNDCSNPTNHKDLKKFFDKKILGRKEKSE